MTKPNRIPFAAAAALLALLPAALVLGTPARANVEDDPPPHPTSCPLCGGDPQVHVDKTFQVGRVAASSAGYVLRW